MPAGDPVELVALMLKPKDYSAFAPPSSTPQHNVVQVQVQEQQVAEGMGKD